MMAGSVLPADSETRCKLRVKTNRRNKWAVCLLSIVLGFSCMNIPATAFADAEDAVPVIRTDLPAYQTVTKDTMVELSIEATGAESYQWQVSNEVKRENSLVEAWSAWTDIENAATSNYKPQTDKYNTLTKYRVNITNKNGTVTSNEITVGVLPEGVKADMTADFSALQVGEIEYGTNAIVKSHLKLELSRDSNAPIYLQYNYYCDGKPREEYRDEWYRLDKAEYDTQYEAEYENAYNENYEFIMDEYNADYESYTQEEKEQLVKQATELYMEEWAKTTAPYSEPCYGAANTLASGKHEMYVEATLQYYFVDSSLYDSSGSKLIQHDFRFESEHCSYTVGEKPDAGKGYYYSNAETATSFLLDGLKNEVSKVDYEECYTEDYESYKRYNIYLNDDFDENGKIKVQFISGEDEAKWNCMAPSYFASEADAGEVKNSASWNCTPYAAAIRTLDINLENGKAECKVYKTDSGGNLEDEYFVLNFVIGNNEVSKLIKTEISEGQWVLEKDLYEKKKAYLALPYGVRSTNVTLTAEDTDKIVFNGQELSKEDNGSFTVKLKSSPIEKGESNIIRLYKDGMKGTAIYEIVCRSAKYDDLPDRVIDYICPDSQYTNGEGLSTYGIRGVGTLLGSTEMVSSYDCLGPASLGNFGGYITYYYKKAIKDDPKNPYGIDFITYGNSVEGSNEFAEPGQVWVSEDGKTWYALAGSAHYDAEAKWDHKVTYSAENQSVYGGISYGYPKKEFYPLHDFADEEYEMTLGGIRLTAASGSNAYGNIRPIFPDFGYVDVGLRCKGAVSEDTEGDMGSNEADNPYTGSHITASGRVAHTATDGMDLAWAVDEAGNPVSFPNGIHYIKIQTATSIKNGGIGEKSTEVNMVRVAKANENAVGKTEKPLSIVIDGNEIKDLQEGKTIPVNVSGAFDVKVNNLKSQKNVSVYVNGTRSNEVYLKEAAHNMVRVIIQESEKEPLIYYFKINDTSGESGKAVTAVVMNAAGVLAKGLVNKTTVLTSYFDEDTFTRGGDIELPQAEPETSQYIFTGWKTEKGDTVKTYNEAVEKAENGVVKLTAQYQRVGGGSGPSDEKITVSFRLIGSTLANGDIDLSKNGTGYKDAKYVTWAKTDSYTLPKGSTVQDLFLAAMKRTGLRQEGAEQGYVRTIYAPSSLGGYALSEFTNGKYSGWMYTMNGSHTDAIADQKLVDGAKIVWHYVNDYRYEVGDWARLGGSGWPQLSDSSYNYWDQWLEAEDVNPYAGAIRQENSVTTDAKAGTTTAPTDVKVSEKTNVDGTKTKVADVKVSADNQKEILKQAKASKSKEIILNVSSKSVGDATKADVTLDKSFIDSIVKDTDAKLTIRTPFGNKTYTQEELKAMSEAATGQTISVAIEKAAEPIDDNAGKVEKAKALTKDLKLVARSAKTAKKNVKVTLKMSSKAAASIKELKDLGYTVKYRYYRSTKKASAYKSAVTKSTKTYLNTAGKKGKMYYYKAQVRVYDENGKLIAKTALKQCKYASRTWSR